MPQSYEKYGAEQHERETDSQTHASRHITATRCELITAYRGNANADCQRKPSAQSRVHHRSIVSCVRRSV
jgi:hypothetical protein